MTGFEVMYLLCVIVGLTWALLSAIFGGLFGGDHGGDAGGHDVGAAGHDAGAAGHDAGAAHGHDGSDHAVHFSPLSPSIIAIFLTSFGAGGFVASQFFHAGPTLSVPFAALAGVLVAGAMLALFAKIFSVTQQSSQPFQQELTGVVGQVITPIPENGVGEISYTVRGSRFTAPARHVQGWAVPAHAPVVIEKLVGSVFFVRRGD